MKTLSTVLLTVLILSLTSCTGHGNLYNLSTGQKTTFSYSYNGRGRGRITGTFASGEVATGEYSVISGGSVGWGSVYGSVYGANGTATGNATAVVMRQDAKRQGSAILTGTNGTIVNCEFALGLSGHGFGACKSNSGILYKLIF